MSARDRVRESLLIAVFCVFFFFYGLSFFGLLGADEPRYAQVAREMLARHDWVTPTLYGQAWLEKPPLYYWGAMISYTGFGVHDWAARVPSAALATLVIFAVYGFLRRMRPGAELAGALIVCSSAAVFGFARGASTDMGLAACFTLAMLAWFVWYGGGQKRWLAWFYVSMALGTLAKGPVAPGLAALVIIGFAALRREPRVIFQTLWPAGLLLYLAVALPWYALVQTRNPQFFTEFIVQQNLARFGSNLYRHEYLFWYYLPVLALGLFPWTLFAAAGAVQAAKFAAGRVEEPGPFEEQRKAMNLYLLLWALVPVIFFSISRSKLPGYILPAIPAWLLLAALYLQRKLEQVQPLRAGMTVAHAGWLAVICGAVALGPWYMLHGHEAVPMNVLRTAIIAAVAVFALVWFSLRLGGWELVRFATLLPAILVVAFALKMAAPVIDATQSARPLAKQLTRYPMATPIETWGTHRTIPYGLAFYRNHAVASRDEGQHASGAHLLIAPVSYEARVQAMVHGGAVETGEYGPQQLEFWWVEPE